jgi:hypothetical protein
MQRLLFLVLACGLTISDAVAQVDQSQAAFERQKQVIAAHDDRFKGCLALHDSGKLKTYKKVAECADAGFVDLMAAAGYRYPDLLNVIVAEHAVIAERLDAKKITYSEAELQNAELISRIAAEVQRRDLEAVKASSDAVAAQAAANAASVAASAAEEQARANALAQSQAQAQAQTAMRAQLLGALLPRLMPAPVQVPVTPLPVVPQVQPPVNTNCVAFGNRWTCNSQ